MALALYRKYRPRTFAEIIGQDHVTEPLSQALRSGRLHHAYLFSGPRGCGKTSSARILARSLNCEQGPTPEPCGVCASCKSLTNDGAGSIDVIEIDAASHGGVDDARDLREKAFFAPASSRYKIYVIDEAHMVSPAGFNALLKLVEEPPEYVKFIFATTEPEKVLGTIRSRTHHYPFRLIPPAILRPYLQQLTEAEGVPVEPAVFPLVVRAGGGSARDTLSVLDQLIAGAGPDGVSYARAVALLGVTDVTLLDDMCDALAAGDGASAFATIDRVAEAGHDPRRFATDLLERFRDLIVMQQVPDAVTKGLIDGPADQLDAMAAQATRLGPATLSRCADIVHNGLVDMRGTTAPRLLLELIMARMLLPGADDSAGAVLQRLERMERRLTLAGDSVRGELPPPPPETAPAEIEAAGGAVSAGGSSSGGGGLSAARAAAAAAAGRRGATGAVGGRAEAAPPAAAAASSVAASPEVPAGGVSGPGVAPEVPAGGDSGLSVAPEAVALSVAPEAGAPSVADGAGQPETAGGSAAAARSEQEHAVQAAPRASSVARPIAEPGYDEEPPWDDEPEPDFERGEPAPQAGPAPQGGPAPQAGPAPRAVTTPRGDGASPAVPPQAKRRTEPAGVLPDAPEEPGAAAVNAGVPGALDVAAVREVWPLVITELGRQSKKVAALVSGATMRDLDGDTVVLTFRFPAHARMVAPEASVISNVLYEVLGTRLQVRCEVAGEGGAAAPTSGGPSRGSSSGNGGGSARNGSSSASPPARAQAAPAAGQQAVRASERAPQTRRRAEDVPPPSDDDWPEPARPGGLATSSSSAAVEQPADDDDDWPEVRAVGGPPPSAEAVDPPAAGGSAAGDVPAAPPAASQAAASSGAATSPAADSAAGSGVTRSPAEGSPTAGSGPSKADAGSPAAGFGSAASGARGEAAADESGSAGEWAGSGGSEVAARAAQADRPDAPEAAPLGSNATASRADETKATRTGNGRNGVPSSGLAAARAAAAAAANARSAGGRPGAKPAAAAAAEGNSGWADGSPTEEAPFDPEFDGAGYEGFDPGDEPLDEVIDEKTARESSEQQAMRLLQEAFGAEKISES